MKLEEARKYLETLPKWLLEQPSSISVHPMMSPMTVREELELRCKFETEEEFASHLGHISYRFEQSLQKSKIKRCDK